MSVITERHIAAPHKPIIRIGIQRPRNDYEFAGASDLEGPHFLGDDARDIVSKFVRPLHPKDGIDYGAILYDEQHAAIMETHMNKGMGQIGSDIALSLPTLLYFGATDRDLEEQALLSKRTPGSAEYMAYLRTTKSHLEAVTTAWEQPHRKMVLEHAGFDRLIATDFPIDQIREKLQHDSKHSETWVREMAIVGKWLGKVFKLIENREENTDEGAKKAITRELRTAITDFYRNDIGITWDNQGRTISFHQTKLGETIAELYVVGDREKAAIVRRLVAQNLLHPAAPGVMFWGDGVNDTLALGDKNGADWRIAFDGDAAAKAANIGVIASDIGKPGIALVKAFKRHPQRRPTPEQIQTVVYEAQEEVGKGAAIIHVAGPNTPISLLHEHRAMKIFIRGERGAAIDHQHEVTT